MPNKRFVVVIGVLCGSAATLAAQEAATCSGPGAAFGVTSYQCASCGLKQGAGVRTTYVFQAEPIVLETAPSSVLKAGDVIVAVNGEPIMTQAGSDQFTYPAAGRSVVTVRRGNARLELTATTAACRAQPDVASNLRTTDPLIVVDGAVVPSFSQIPPREQIETVEVLRGPAAVLYRADPDRAVIVIKTKRRYTSITPLMTPAPRDTSPLIIVDGVVQANAREADVNQSAGGRRFGFAISCVPSCTRAKASDGTEYYKFDAYPPIAALTPGGPAERAGIRVGDLVAQIDGQSILGEEGALRFFRANRKDSMHLMVMRDRAVLAYLLKSR
jgi:membrane-associated protease RseP (regulator of RpoE activity)